MSATEIWNGFPSVSGVADLATLGGITIGSPPPVGALVYVQSVNEFFRFMFPLTTVPDGVNVLDTHLGGDTRWVKTGIVSGVAPGGSAAIIWQPGGVSVGQIYATWHEVQTAIAGLTAPFVVYVDQTLGVPIIPAASGVTDFKLLGTLSGASDGANVTIEEGATLRDVIALSNCSVICLATATPSFSFTYPGGAAANLSLSAASLFNASGTAYPTITVPPGAVFNLYGTSPRIVGAASYQSVVGSISPAPATFPVIHYGAGSSGVIAAFYATNIIDQAISGDVTASLSFQYDSMPGFALSNLGASKPFPTFSAFLGTLTWSAISAVVPGLTILSGITPYHAHPNERVTVNLTGGNAQIVAPPASLGSGALLIVKVSLAGQDPANTCTITPTAPDTIEGGATYVFGSVAGDLSSRTFLSDGASNWELIGKVN